MADTWLDYCSTNQANELYVRQWWSTCTLTPEMLPIWIFDKSPEASKLVVKELFVLQWAPAMTGSRFTICLGRHWTESSLSSSLLQHTKNMECWPMVFLSMFSVKNKIIFLWSNCRVHSCQAKNTNYPRETKKLKIDHSLQPIDKITRAAGDFAWTICVTEMFFDNSPAPRVKFGGKCDIQTSDVTCHPSVICPGVSCDLDQCKTTMNWEMLDRRLRRFHALYNAERWRGHFLIR